MGRKVIWSCNAPVASPGHDLALGSRFRLPVTGQIREERCLALFPALARLHAFGGRLFPVALRMNAESVP
jgi:hypothetical protein